MKFYITFQMDTHIYTMTLEYYRTWGFRLEQWIKNNINRIQSVKEVSISKYLSDDEFRVTFFNYGSMIHLDDNDDDLVLDFARERINHYKNQ
jgi:hypothetical protein